MKKTKISTNENFDEIVEIQFQEVLAIYNLEFEKMPEKNFLFRSKHARKQILSMQESSYKHPKSSGVYNTEILFVMEHRYREYVNEQYTTDDTRFIEWYAEEWPELLQGVISKSPTILPEMEDIRVWSQIKIAEFLAREIAILKVLRHSDQALNEFHEAQKAQSASLLPEQDINTKTSNQYSIKQATAAVVCLLSDKHHDIIFGSNLTAFARFISALTGYGQDNVLKQLKQWKNSRPAGPEGENSSLIAVLEDILDISRDIDVSDISRIIRDKE